MLQSLVVRKLYLLQSVLFAAVLAGCGPGGHPPDGVVTPRVSATRTEVSPGSVIEIAYDLEVRADAPRFDENYRVLVGFLDTAGEVLWRDDHVPPGPSTTWISGRTVSYSRPVLVPRRTPGGPVTLVLALEAADGERAVLVAEHLGSREYRVASFEVSSITDVRWIPDYESGFHPREQNDRATWSWTTGEATLAYRNPLSSVVLYLAVGMQAGRFERPQVVTLSVRGEVVDSFEIVGGRTTYGRVEIAESLAGVDTFKIVGGRTTYRRVEIAESLVGTVDPFRITIHVDQTFVPAAAGGEDPRELGVRVFSAIINPEHAGRPAAGLADAQRDAQDDPLQWSTRRVVIFGPPGATRLELPLRRSPGLAQTVRVSLNGGFVEEVVLDDDAWHRSDYELPPSRDGVVSAELLVSPVTWVEGDPLPRGVMVGEYRWR